MPSPEPLIEGRDFTVDPAGRYVFTAYYLLRRGRCCGSKCRNCPYDAEGRPRPEVAARYPDLTGAPAAAGSAPAAPRPDAGEATAPGPRVAERPTNEPKSEP